MYRKLIIIFFILLLCFKVNLFAEPIRNNYRPQLWYSFVQLEHFLPDPEGNLGLIYKVNDDLWYHNSEGDIYKLNTSSDVSGTGYYVDYTNPDQGLIGNGKTIKAYVDLIGSNYATIILPHHESIASQTEYILNTNETIPSNITIKIEEGAYIDGSATLLDNGPLIAYKNCFGNSIDINFANGEDSIPNYWFIDGNSDDIEINKAIDSLTIGGKVKLLGENYHLSNQIFIDSNYITIEGENNTNLFLDSNNVYGFYVDHYPNIKISTINMIGTLDSDPTNNKALIYRHYTGSPNDDSHGFVIKNCVFSKYTEEAIYISTSSVSGDVIIDNCRFEDTNNPSSKAIRIGSDGIKTISNCFFREICQGINLDSGGTGQTFISNNHFFALEDYNIYLDVRGIFISNNEFIGGEGIFIYSNSDTTTISNNFFYNWEGGTNGSIYLKSYNHAITNNIFSSSHFIEIYFDTANNCKVIDNIFKKRSINPKPDWNIYLISSHDIDFSNNSFDHDSGVGTGDIYIDTNSYNVTMLSNFHSDSPYYTILTDVFGTINLYGSLKILGSVVSGPYNYGSDTAADDDYIITTDPEFASYTKGTNYYFDANNANIGACTANFNSIGAKSIKIQHDNDPNDNCIEKGMMINLIYDGTNMQMLNPCAN